MQTPAASSSTTPSARPGQLNYGSAGNGGISHLVPEMFKSATGLFMVHIPYRGSAPAFTDLMGGQVQFMAESIPQAASYHKQGKVRALAVTSRERNPALPDVPTVIEAGIKGFEVVGFYGFLAPAGTAEGRDRQAQRRLPAGAGQPRGAQPHGERRAPIRPSWAARTSPSSWPPKCRAGPTR